VPLSVVLDCIRVASHAPIGSNREATRWLVLTDPTVKKAVGEIYAEVARPYLAAGRTGVAPDSRQARQLAAADHLVEHLHEVPVLVLALRLGRVVEGRVGADPQAFFGSVIPSVWNFQLAARARGLGTRYTTFTADREAEMADLLGIPDDVTQVCLLPVAYYLGDDFRPAPRRPAEQVTFVDRWGNPPPATRS
jgi:nitroreductase